MLTFISRLLCAPSLSLSIATASLLAAASPTAAQSHIEVMEQCKRAIENDDQNALAEAATLVVELRNVAAFLIGPLRDCLEKATSEDWEYPSDLRRFVRPSEVEAVRLAVEAERLAAAGRIEAERLAAEKREAEYKEAVRARVCELRGLVQQSEKTIEDAEAAREQRRIETLLATSRECTVWFDESPREALTNDTCNSIFAAYGLPNSTTIGPSQAEVLHAESLKLDAQTELTIVAGSGQLLADWRPTYLLSPEEADEDKDDYDCSR